MKKDIIFLGIQGCGKGTQAKILLEKLSNYFYFEMGQTLRALTLNNNLIGDHIKDVLSSGKMIDNYITYDLIHTSLKIAQKNNKSIIIDGFPRMLDQAEFFVNISKEMNRDYIVVYLELSKEKSLERMLHRSKIEGRNDDNEEAMNNRISIFYNNTVSVIQYFDCLGKVIKISAEDTIENISNNIIKKLSI